MKVDNCISVSFTEEELKDALIIKIECALSDLVPGTSEFDRLENLIEHLKNNECIMEWYEGEFVLTSDGILEDESWEIEEDHVG